MIRDALDDMGFWQTSRRLYPVVEPELWALRYGLVIRETACAECKNPVWVNRPVFAKEWLGFEGSFCSECGLRCKSIHLIVREISADT